MIDQLLEWINYRPSDHFSEWILVAPVVVVIVLWLFTTALLITRWRPAWKTKTCETALECHYVVTLLPWGVFMIPVAVVLTLSTNERNSGVEDLLLRTLIVAFAVLQTLLLWRYAKGDHKHE